MRERDVNFLSDIGGAQHVNTSTATWFELFYKSCDNEMLESQAYGYMPKQSRRRVSERKEIFPKLNNFQ